MIINVGWKFFERGTSLIIVFIVQILLARILEPTDFGIATMVTVFVSLSTIFVSGGLSNSLIQKRNADELDFSSIFWVNLAVSVSLYFILFFSAPAISNYFGYKQLTPMIRVLSINLLIIAVNSIQIAYISKNMMFRFYFLSTISGKAASGIVGILIAIFGGGAWAIVGQTLSMSLFETLVLWNKVKWRPTFIFSYERVKKLYSFAWKIMFMTFIESITDQLRNLLIGKRYSSEALAYYNKGLLFPTIIVTNISSSLIAVMFPVISDVQDDNDRAILMCRKWISISAYVILPILVGLILTAEQLIPVILTEKWLFSIPYLQIAGIFYVSWIIELPIRETLKSLGHADEILKLQIIKSVVALIMIFIVANLGVMAIAVSSVGIAFVNVLLSVYASGKLLKYDLKKVTEDIYPSLRLNFIMGIFIIGVSQFNLGAFFLLILKVIVGILVYVFASILFKDQNYLFIKRIVENMVNKRGIKKEEL